MNDTLVSIVVPILNAKKSIEKCVESLINQTYPNIEIVLVDNGSTDETIKLLKGYQGSEKIRVFFEENPGVFYARNRGIENSNGKYITFVDADDYLEQNAIEKEIELLNKENSEILFFDYYFEKNEQSKKCNNKSTYGLYKNYNREKLLLDMCIGKYFASVWRGIFLADIVKNKTFFRKTKFAEDLLFDIECILKASRISVVDVLLYHYVDNDESALKKIQHDLQNTIDYLKQFDNVVAENSGENLQNIYVQTLNICCLRILNTSIKYQEFKKWFLLIEPIHLTNSSDRISKYVKNHNTVKAYIILWCRKIVNKIKRED